jgi:hypothetical protein
VLVRTTASLDSVLTDIRGHFDPRDSAILTLVGHDAYRFMMYYLPEYTVLRLDLQMRTVLTAQAHHQGSWSDAGDCLFVDDHVRHAAWVVSSPTEPGSIPQDARLISDSTEPGPFQVWEVERTPSTLEYLGFRIANPCRAAFGGT